MALIRAGFNYKNFLQAILLGCIESGDSNTTLTASRSAAAIYQVQKLLRETFDAETNSELVQKVVSLKLLDVATQ
jgi:hypothetical protein